MTELLDAPTGADGATARRRRWLRLVAAALVGAAVFVLYWFQPQKLFTDDQVDEAIPSATTEAADVAPPPGGSAASAPPATAAPTEPVELARGEFVSLDHGTSGSARVLELADGRRIVRLEGLDTSNGPDLYVYLSPSTAGGDESAFDDDHLDLGRLKGNQGDQNYDLPADVDLARFASVVIWCDRFDSAFGAADLTAT
jgi:hypothetical protein